MNDHRPLPALAPTLLRLAGPVALARLGMMGMGIVDTIVVGQIAPHELAFLALGWAPTGVLLVTGIGLLTGVQVLSARAVGEGRPEDAGAVWRRGMTISAGAGLLFGALLWFASDNLLKSLGINADLADGAARVTRVLALSMPFQFAHIACSYFLEAIKRPLMGTIVVTIANGVNLALNLAFVPSLGAEGAAWSTLGARAFIVAALVIWIFISADSRAHSAHKRASGAGYGALFGVGAASAISQMAEAGAFNAMSVIAGRISAEAVAAYQILLNVLAVVFMVALGFSSATSVLVSEAHGRGDAQRTARAGWMGLWLNTISMALCAMAFLVFAEPIARVFTSDPALIKLVAGLLLVCAIIVVPDGGQVVAAQALRGRGDNWFPSASHIFSYVLIMPPLGFFLAEVSERGVSGLMEAIFVASVFSVSVLGARFWWLSRHANTPRSDA